MQFDKKSQLQKAKKPKTCKICGKEIYKGKVCGIVCALKYADEQSKKKIQQEKNKQVKEFNQKDKSYLVKQAQTQFNKFIRLRDGNKCITCRNTDRQIHAGHYMPTGRNSALRFNEDNCHSQCSICNNYKSGNLAVYRLKLIDKIGLEKVEWLEAQTQSKSWGIDELKNIIETYKIKIKNMIQ
ncbi:MAG: recombination protein NinG [Gammaproteobacteria bacterium]|nr:recombination protein NinG [Gammaproteobacteria bacterium]